jgi:hypothetical protein
MATLSESCGQIKSLLPRRSEVVESKTSDQRKSREVFAPASKSQRAGILRLLLGAKGGWVPLPDILALGIAQYNARILELRQLGFDIENKTECVNRIRHSWFRLVVKRQSVTEPQSAAVVPSNSTTGVLPFDSVVR